MGGALAVPPRPGLDEYEAVGSLAGAVRDLRAAGVAAARRLTGRTVWMVNSTAAGGGVAEMLPTVVTLLRELGIATEWVVMEADDPAFFRLTKDLHNMVHGVDGRRPGEEERRLYERVSRANAAALGERMRSGDVLVVHDPQPMGIAAELTAAVPGVRAVWRCHIGLDRDTDATRAAWEFLRPWAAAYQRVVFSMPEYVPDFLRDRARVVRPAIDPLSEKNRHLSLHKIVGTLVNSGLAAPPGPVLTPDYDERATRLRADGRFTPASAGEDIGLLSRPIVTQVSRWDRLKGWAPLLEAFARLKRNARRREGGGEHARRLALARLVLAGPDPASVVDDPEGREVLEELTGRWLDLPEPIQRDVALVALPMTDPGRNGSMVNALQRASTIVVQNSVREGFGLTIAEAMWKRIPVLSNRQASGPRDQVRDGVDGRLIGDPEDPDELEEALAAMLASPREREVWGRNAQRHVHERFLLFGQLRAWLELLAEVV